MTAALENIDFEGLWVHCRDDNKVTKSKVADWIYYHHDCGPIDQARENAMELAGKAIEVYEELGYINKIKITVGNREIVQKLVWQI